jgi:hypothetical protein
VYGAIAAVDRQKPHIPPGEFAEDRGQIFGGIRFDKEIAERIGRALPESIAICAVAQTVGIADKSEFRHFVRGAPKARRVRSFMEMG